MSVSKGVLLIGGPSKGTRMRPLTLDCPKPLLPIAGKPMIWHPLSAFAKVPGLTEVIMIGFYEDSVMSGFIKEAKREFPNIAISYLREYKALGTAGGLYHFRDSILRPPVPQNIFICNIDICSAFPFTEILELHSKHRGVGTIMGVNVRKESAQKYGCIVTEPESQLMVHYVEKPDSWISNTVNGGVYLFDKSLFDEIKIAMDEKTARAAEDPLVKPDEILRLEQDVIVPLAAAKKMYVYQCKDFWRQIKTAASAVTANSLYLARIQKTYPDFLAKSSPNVISPVYIDSTATIDPTAKIGPNVAIGPGVTVGAGVRVKDAIVLEGTNLEQHSCVLNSIVGANCNVGAWARVDGKPEPEQDVKGQISVTILATEVSLAPETLVRSCIVLPNKSLNRNSANEVLL
ncbi:mannose-1-phosphate guanylyltransferase [Kwoniella mangroviensis CBS 10435]|uniref:mannose-1-phosphate guanylyltransferase n=1 Tax=Kwoniella mangroviensis CBS 10435 TaxID=1331196 RepID=A0A1B9IQ46_9TREE|nr:mannose-1-phosphate guanylyltransferase [Kwoniella mangroviensis CBS 10435]OCF75935.1 mannose-1-phosphate guanylyltransferase [Kwoniella mangroviensis CBS 8886]